MKTANRFLLTKRNKWGKVLLALWEAYDECDSAIFRSSLQDQIDFAIRRISTLNYAAHYADEKEHEKSFRQYMKTLASHRGE